MDLGEENHRGWVSFLPHKGTYYQYAYCYWFWSWLLVEVVFSSLSTVKWLFHGVHFGRKWPYTDYVWGMVLASPFLRMKTLHKLFNILLHKISLLYLLIDPIITLVWTQWYLLDTSCHSLMLHYIFLVQIVPPLATQSTSTGCLHLSM